MELNKTYCKSKNILCEYREMIEVTIQILYLFKLWSFICF